MLQAIIDFFRQLFGLDTGATSSPAALHSPSAGAAAAAPARDDGNADARDSGGSTGGTPDRLSLLEGDVIRRVDGAVLMRDEDDGELLWHSEVNLEMRPDQFEDDWGPLGGPDDLDKFLFHETEVNMVMQGDPEAAEKKAQEFGYAHMGQLFRVRATMLKHKGDATGDLLEDYVFTSEDVMRAAMGGAHLRQQYTQDNALSANPELLAPVDGVDVETFAQLSAATAKGLSQEEFNALLATKGLDAAKWSEINAVWTDRMSKDTSFTITNIYSKAFAGAGQGQFGGASQAAAAAMGTTNAAGGDEPVSFDRYCEIQGAQTAWSQSGQDVNAMLKQVFDMNALDWSNMSTWWMQKMQSQPSLFEKYSELCAKYEAQYGGGGMAGADDDLSF